MSWTVRDSQYLIKIKKIEKCPVVQTDTDFIFSFTPILSPNSLLLSNELPIYFEVLLHFW